MKWLTFIPPKNLLQQIEGVEKGLQQNKRIGKIGWIGFIISLLPILIEVIKWWEKVDWASLQNFTWSKLLDPVWVWQQLSFSELLLIPLLSLTTFVFLLIWNRFWLKESNEPFRYTFSLEDFKPILGENIDADPFMGLLSHHLCDKINERIGRLLLLDEKYLVNGNGESKAPKEGFPQSHIHICGHYTKRKDRHGQWVLEIMPRVRIGPPGSPETLAYPTVYPLGPGEPGSANSPAIPLNSETEKYDQILERLYFRVATEIYKQIQLNVKQKVELLPNDYFRAVALFYEAEDYARSNTLEAYDEARKLYEQSIYYFDPTLRPFSKNRGKKFLQQVFRRQVGFRRQLRHLAAFIFPHLDNRELMQARAETGYARMILFRRNLSGLLGQSLYPVFETRPVAERAVQRIERLSDEITDKKKYLFDADVACALSWMYLGSAPDAKAWLKKAEMLDPNRASDDAIYNFVYGEVEAHLRTELQIFQRVTELEPRFEVAQFSLAIKSEYLWRTRLSLERNVAETVLGKYEEVLKLNPGNVGAWANRGYICWLLGGAEDLRIAREDYLSGREYKEIKRETFVAELDHGLARIAAEQGDFVGAYEYYINAASANVSQPISSYVEYYYILIHEALFQRYQRYLETVKRNFSIWEDIDEPYREFKELLAALRNDKKDVSAHIKKLQRFIDAACQQIPFESETGLNEWLLANTEEIERLLGTFNEDFALQTFFKRLREKLSDPLLPSAIPGLLGIISDPVFAAFMKSRFENKANKRVRKAILAFVYNDYGDACYYYYRQDGDERFFDRAREAYQQATELNPAFAIPFFNLQRLSTWKWDFEKSKKYLKHVTQIEPNWTESKLALAEVNSRLAEEKQKEAEKEKQQETEKRGEIKRLKKEAEELEQEAGRLREKIQQRREQRFSGEVAVPIREAQQPGSEFFKASYVRFPQPDSSQAPSKLNIPGMSMQSARESELPEERALNEIQKKIEALNQNIANLESNIEAHRENAGSLNAQCDALAEEALDTLQSLLPHQYFWTWEEGKKRFNTQVLSSAANGRQWEKEVNHLHVTTLHYLGLVLKSQKQFPGAEAVFSHIQRYYWPAEVYELRNILENRLKKTLAENPVYKELQENSRYRRLLNDEDTFKMLMDGRHLTLYWQSKEYRELMGNSGYRALLWSAEHKDVLRYYHSQRTLFALGENWALENAYPYWALNYAGYDSAFSANRDGPLFYSGLKLKAQKDFYIEAGNERNRSEYFYFWLGDKLRELKFVDEALAVWLLCQDTRDPYILVRLAGDLKLLESWDESLELYRRAMKYDRRYAERSKSEYHHQCGFLLWAMEGYEDAIAEFNQVKPEDDEIPSGIMTQIVQELIPFTNNRQSYTLLKNWLESRQILFAEKALQNAQEDAHSARMLLVREKYPQIHAGGGLAASASGAAPMMSVVTPAALEIDAGLFRAPAQAYSENHPLVKIHYPAVQNRIRENIGLSIPGLRVRVNDGMMAQNTYTIIIMEVPIVMGTVDPPKRFLPEYQTYQALLEHFQVDMQPAYDPLTGEMSGIWIGENNLANIQVPIAETWDCFEYIAYHLESVIFEHFGKFLNVQKSDELLSLWEKEGDEEESKTKQDLIKQALPNTAAQIRFTELLYWLLNEGVPIVNLKALLETFKKYNAPNTDITEIVEAARLTLKEDLPGNEAANRFLALSPEFEAEVMRNIRRTDGKIFFAIEPESTQALLAAVRDGVSSYRHWKTVIVTRSEGLRFQMRRLLEIEFPRVKILSAEELKPEFKKLISKTIPYQPK